MERNVLEFVDHLHEHFVTPCSINAQGRYNAPINPKEGYRFVHLLHHLNPIIAADIMSVSIEMHKSSIDEYEWPTGTYWQKRIAEGTA